MYDLNEKQRSERINPFTSIWLRSRQTARYAIESKSMGFVILIILLSGIGSGLMSMQSSGLHDTVQLWLILIGMMILFPLISLASTAIMSAIYLAVGKLFKGTSSYTEMFKAVGVSMIPYIWLAPLLILWILIAPDSYFADPFAVATPSGAEIASLIIFTLISVIVTIWTIVIQSKVVGEAHRFSSWKGFFTIMIPAVLIGLVVFVVIVLFFIIIVVAGRH